MAFQGSPGETGTGRMGRGLGGRSARLVSSAARMRRMRQTRATTTYVDNSTGEILRRRSGRSRRNGF